MTLVLQMCVLPLLILYMVTLVVAYLGWVDIDLDVPPSCTATQPILPSSPLPSVLLAITLGRPRPARARPRPIYLQPCYLLVLPVHVLCLLPVPGRGGIKTMIVGARECESSPRNSPTVEWPK